jgi:tetratricopeptide (TPR) repeat protein
MKINNLSKKQFTVGVICLVVILITVILIYSHSKKQMALYSKYLDMASESMKSEGNETEAIKLFTNAIEIYPKKPKAYWGRALVYYFNNQNDEALKDTDTVLSLTKDSPEAVFKLRGDIFKEEDRLEPAVEAYAMAYSLSPSDRDSVHDYVSSLVALEQSDKAYPIIKKYFDETPKDIYWEDADMWLDMGITSLQTHRCLGAATGAWHALMRTKEGEDAHKLSEAIMSGALNAKDCIDTGDKKEMTAQSMKDTIAKNEAKIFIK